MLEELRGQWPARETEDAVVSVDATAAPAAKPDVEAFVRKARSKVGNLDKFAKRLVGLAVEANRASVDERLASEIHRAIGINVGNLLVTNGPLLQAMQVATKENVALIRTIPEQYLDRVYDTVSEGWVQGLRWESLVEQIQEDGNITERRAKLIARDQTSKMNAAFNQERQQQVGIERYEWSTSADERVRPSHVEMEGKTCDWDNPPVVDEEQVHPGEAINCRCVAIPVVDMDSLDLLSGSPESEAA